MRCTPTLVNTCTMIDDTLFVLEHFCEVGNDNNPVTTHMKLSRLSEVRIYRKIILNKILKKVCGA